MLQSLDHISRQAYAISEGCRASLGSVVWFKANPAVAPPFPHSSMSPCRAHVMIVDKETVLGCTVFQQTFPFHCARVRYPQNDEIPKIRTVLVSARATENLQADQNKFVVPSSHAIDPIPSRCVGLNLVTLPTRAREDSGREVPRKRYADSAHRVIGRGDLEAEGSSVRRPLG